MVVSVVVVAAVVVTLVVVSVVAMVVVVAVVIVAVVAVVSVVVVAAVVVVVWLPATSARSVRCAAVSARWMRSACSLKPAYSRSASPSATLLNISWPAGGRDASEIHYHGY